MPKIETERLLLRPLVPEDADAAFAWCGDERVTRYMGYSTYHNVEQLREWLSSVNNDYNFGFERKGLLIGSGSVNPVEDGFWSFGYNLRYDCWNKGYTTEAARAMIKYAYDNCGARKFMSQHAVDNSASGRVMEKCGLVFDRFGSYKKLDGSAEFRSKVYIKIFGE